MSQSYPDTRTASAVTFLWCALLVVTNLWFVQGDDGPFFGLSFLGVTALVGPLLVSPAMVLWLLLLGFQRRVPTWIGVSLSLLAAAVSLACFLRAIQVHMTM